MCVGPLFVCSNGSALCFGNIFVILQNIVGCCQMCTTTSSDRRGPSAGLFNLLESSLVFVAVCSVVYFTSVSLKFGQSKLGTVILQFVYFGRALGRSRFSVAVHCLLCIYWLFCKTSAVIGAQQSQRTSGVLFFCLFECFSTGKVTCLCNSLISCVTSVVIFAARDMRYFLQLLPTVPHQCVCRSSLPWTT